MQFIPNYPLSQITTFHIGGSADYFVRVVNRDELLEAIDFAKKKGLSVLVLGGGSNVLISDYGFRGLVIQLGIKGIKIVEENEQHLLISVEGGEVWDDVVGYAVKNNYWGIENLSHVSGNTGAVPVQNVGCYGQEASDVVEKIEVLDLTDRQIKQFNKADLDFSYRTSKLNKEWKNKFVILTVYFRLNKIPNPNLTYVDLKNYFEERNQTTASLTEIRKALEEIRGNKFPKIQEMGSDGSFFKNLLLNKDQLEILDENIKKNFPSEVAAKYEAIKNKFPVKDAVKIPAAFLIDICGLKGRAVGDARLWEKQPLVIVNVRNARASDVVELFNQVKQEVLAKTGMELQAEPEFIGFK